MGGAAERERREKGEREETRKGEKEREGGREGGSEDRREQWLKRPSTKGKESL